jgi:hypothetical protein
MVILNNLRYYVFGLFILFVNSGIYGVAHCQSKIDTIRITFSYMGGYVPNIAMACYVYQSEVYQLQTVQTYKSDDLQLPMIICKEVVAKLLNDCSLYSTEDECDYINITKDDYFNYIKILNDSYSLKYYFPLLDFPTYSQDFKKEQYELKEDEFLSLCCSDIIEIGNSHFSRLFTPSKPLIEICLVDSYGKIISIGPKGYYEGSAWVVNFQGKERYIDFECAMSFLRDIQFDRYAYFWNRFYLLFQIAENKKRIEEIGASK